MAACQGVLQVYIKYTTRAYLHTPINACRCLLCSALMMTLPFSRIVQCPRPSKRSVLTEALGTIILKCKGINLVFFSFVLIPENASSLAEALKAIMFSRKDQENFQLIIITHDESFAHQIGTREHAEYLWRIVKVSVAWKICCFWIGVLGVQNIFLLLLLSGNPVTCLHNTWFLPPAPCPCLD